MLSIPAGADRDKCRVRVEKKSRRLSNSGVDFSLALGTDDLGLAGCLVVMVAMTMMTMRMMPMMLMLMLMLMMVLMTMMMVVVVMA